MIFVTGDVHERAIGGPDARLLRERGLTEAECALRFAELAGRYGVPTTLFVTGEAAQESPDVIARLGRYPGVELGGHTWNSLRPRLRHYLADRLHGSFYGSESQQRTDIRRTVAAIEQATGRRIRVWRTHAYRGDATTDYVLASEGFRAVSDRVEPDGAILAVTPELRSVPITTPPDHDHLLHGAYTAARMDEDRAIRETPLGSWRLGLRREHRRRWAKELVKRTTGTHTPVRPFGERHLDAETWWEWTSRVTAASLQREGFAMLSLHPACMELLDGMQLFERMLAELARQRCAFLGEVSLEGAR